MCRRRGLAQKLYELQSKSSRVKNVFWRAGFADHVLLLLQDIVIMTIYETSFQQCMSQEDYVFSLESNLISWQLKTSATLLMAQIHPHQSFPPQIRNLSRDIEEVPHDRPYLSTSA